MNITKRVFVGQDRSLRLQRFFSSKLIPIIVAKEERKESRNRLEVHRGRTKEDLQARCRVRFTQARPLSHTHTKEEIQKQKEGSGRQSSGKTVQVQTYLVSKD